VQNQGKRSDGHPTAHDRPPEKAGPMPNDMPLVSVIMAAYNAEKFIGEAIESLQAQTYENWELLCVDDVSEDDTTVVVAGYAEADARIKLIRNETNLGPAGARNVALDHATGEFIAVLDADDVSLPDRFERSLQLLRERPEAGLVGSGAYVVDERGASRGTIFGGALDEPGIRGKLLQQGCQLCHSSVMGRRALVARVGGYDERLPVAHDYDLYLRLLAVTDCVRIAPPMVKWRKHMTQVSVKSRIRQAYYADFARRRAVAAAGGEPFDEDAELARVGRRVMRSVHWLPAVANCDYSEAQDQMRMGNVAEARSLLKRSLRLCPGFVRAVPWLALSYLPASSSTWIAAAWHSSKTALRGHNTQTRPRRSDRR